jgi:hypothetical protein
VAAIASWALALPVLTTEAADLPMTAGAELARSSVAVTAKLRVVEAAAVAAVAAPEEAKSPERLGIFRETGALTHEQHTEVVVVTRHVVAGRFRRRMLGSRVVVGSEEVGCWAGTSEILEVTRFR